jgi:hypothetical protein
MISNKEFSQNPETDVTNRGSKWLSFQKKIKDLFQPQEGRVNTNYERLANDPRYIPAYLDLIKSSLEKESIHANYELAFYLNSSDSLTSLEQLDQKRKKVMTVAGSGEFAHAFVNNGASEIISFDISPAGAFNAELRQVALCNLSMEDYLELFGSWTQGWDDDGSNYPIYDQDMYSKIRDNLSAEARQYFDLLFEDPELITFHRRSVLKGFARARHNKKHGHNRFIGDIITTENEYKKLQRKARRVKFTQTICNAREMDDLIESVQPDQIYQSNIGFKLNRVVRNALHNSRLGSEVVCTVGLGSEELQQKDNDYYYQGKKIEVGDVIYYEIEGGDSGTVQVPIKIIGLDSSATFGMTILINRN